MVEVASTDDLLKRAAIDKLLQMKDAQTYAAQFIAQDRLGALINAKYISLTPTECVYEYEVDTNHLNPNGILHGGALFTAMDSCQGMLMHFILDETFRTAATGTATIKYFVPVQSGVIRIHTTLEERQNRKYFLSSVAKDASGKQVAMLEEIWIGIPI